jgi:Ser/Thr protein kinase RdoA (MazF antagonist)
MAILNSSHLYDTVMENSPTKRTLYGEAMAVSFGLCVECSKRSGRDRYCKVYSRHDKFASEISVLRFLASSHLREQAPKILRVCGDRVVEIEFLDGNTPACLTPELAIQLGRFANKVHRTGKWSSFGYLGSQATPHNSYGKFSDFLQNKMVQWTDRLRLDNRILATYVVYCWSSIGRQRALLDSAEPVFCHGDFVLKNVLVKNSRFTAMVDWEDAGILCLEWEIRKLVYLFARHPEVKKAFIDGYGEVFAADSTRVLNVAQHLAEIDLLGHAGWCLIQDRPTEYHRTLRRMAEILGMEPTR